MHYYVNVDKYKLKLWCIIYTKMAMHVATTWHHISWHWRSGWVYRALRKTCKTFYTSLYIIWSIYRCPNNMEYLKCMTFLMHVGFETLSTLHIFYMFYYFYRYILGIQMLGATTKIQLPCINLILGFSACWQLEKPLEHLQIQVYDARWLLIIKITRWHLMFK